MIINGFTFTINIDKTFIYNFHLSNLYLLDVLCGGHGFRSPQLIQNVVLWLTRDLIDWWASIAKKRLDVAPPRPSLRPFLRHHHYYYFFLLRSDDDEANNLIVYPLDYAVTIFIASRSVEYHTRRRCRGRDEAMHVRRATTRWHPRAVFHELLQRMAVDIDRQTAVDWHISFAPWFAFMPNRNVPRGYYWISRANCIQMAKAEKSWPVDCGACEMRVEEEYESWLIVCLEEMKNWAIVGVKHDNCGDVSLSWPSSTYIDSGVASLDEVWAGKCQSIQPWETCFWPMKRQKKCSCIRKRSLTMGGGVMDEWIYTHK